jgi:hydroxymethylpyrimidine pyrophosphatase-like HAD family hydrolase
MQLGKSAAVTIFHERVDWLATVVVPMLHTVIEANAWPMRVSMTWTCINVDLAHVSKGGAIQRVIQRFGLDPARLAGIGDTTSDLAIRDHVAWFACPANAAAELKTRADRVAAAPECAGVAEILDELAAEAVTSA